jgi:NADH:ubiquinone oxidoreductase subunit 2 (subunit N)
MWSPDVYEGAWLPITAILVVLVKLVFVWQVLYILWY